MSLKELNYMLGSTTHVIEGIDSMDHHTEHVALMGHGVEGNQLVKVCMYGCMLISHVFTSGTMSAHTTQRHYIGIIDQWK